MKKAIYTGIFCTILGLCINTPANASIVSSGFLDEKLTEMTNATTLQLDTKANQSDLMNLSNIVGTPAELTYRDIIRSGGVAISELMGRAYYDAYGDNTVPTNNISELINLNYTDIDFPGLAGVVESLLWARKGDDNWPTRLADIFNDYEYLSKEGHWNFFDLIISGGTLKLSDITVYGLKDLTTKVDANTAKIDANTAKIGTLPSGDIVHSALLEALFKSSPATDTTDTPVYPNSLSDLIYQLYGNIAMGPGIIDSLLWGFKFVHFGGAVTEVGIVPAMYLGLEAKTAADANTAKIGTLPTEYATVGAALSAIKGIAEEAKAAALAAIPDPKQEGSNGKFVLTVDIVGDNATYRWEPIDRGDTTSTTE